MYGCLHVCTTWSMWNCLLFKENCNGETSPQPRTWLRTLQRDVPGRHRPAWKKRTYSSLLIALTLLRKSVNRLSLPPICISGWRVHARVWPFPCFFVSGKSSGEQEEALAVCFGPAIHSELRHSEKVNLASPPLLCLICTDH